MLSKIYNNIDPTDVLVVDFVQGYSEPTIRVRHVSEGKEATINIESGDIIDGDLRPSVHMGVCEWIESHRDDIEQAWIGYLSGKRNEKK